MFRMIKIPFLYVCVHSLVRRLYELSYFYKIWYLIVKPDEWKVDFCKENSCRFVIEFPL